MKRPIVYCLSSIVLFFCFSSSAFAEAVYLKNGRVMVGRIVEKTPSYMVLKRGEGAGAVKTTIFLEDIAKVESEEEFFRNIPIVPPFLGTGEQPSLIADPDISSQVFSGNYDSRERIRSLVEANKKLAANESLPATQQDVLPEIDRDLRGVVGNPLAQQTYLSLAQLAREREERYSVLRKAALEAKPPETGTGRISGVVAVPESGAVLSRDGTRALYVYLLRKKPDGKFFFPVPMVYGKVSAENVALGKASYMIKDIPAGLYKVVAEWDVAAPPIQEQVVNAKLILNFLGSRGDYQGEYPETIAVQDTTDLSHLNFSAVTLLEADLPTMGWQVPIDFEILDIYYYSSEPTVSKFILLVKNPKKNSIDQTALDLFINGDRIVFPLEIGPIGPGQEKQYDITEFVDYYERMEEAQGPVKTAGPRSFNFVVRDPGTKEAVFEKAISVL